MRVVSSKCADDECTEPPTWGMVGSKKPKYCVKHALQGMVYIFSKNHADDECSGWTTGGVSGSRKRASSTEVSRDEIYHVVDPRKSADGESYKGPTDRINDIKQEHNVENAELEVDSFPSTGCAAYGHAKQTNDGLIGSRDKETCAEHASEERVNVAPRACVVRGCSKRPIFGVNKRRKPTYCGEHASESMVNVYFRLSLIHI